MIPVFLAMLASLAGASIAAVSPSVRPGIVAVAAGAMAFETALLRPRLDDAADSRLAATWRRVELVGLVVGVKLLQTLAGTTELFDLEFGLAAGVGVLVWGFVNSTLTDLGAIDRAIELTDGMTPLQRIRLRWVALGFLAVACAAGGAVGLDGLLDLERGAAAAWSSAPLAYFVVGLAGLGGVSRMTEDRRWRRDGAAIDPHVARHWLRSVLVTVLALGLVGAVLQAWTTGVTAVPVRGLAASGRFGSWLSERAAGLRAGVDSSGPAGGGAGDPVPAPPVFEVAEPAAPWLGDVALWVFVGLIFAFAVFRGRQRRTGVPADAAPGLGLGGAMRLVWTALFSFVAGLWAGVRRVLGRVAAAGQDRVSPGRGSVGTGNRWDPLDPIRRRIAAAYRVAVAAAAAGHGPPGPPETPREFAGRVDDDRLTTVTEVFEEARYSNHLLTDSDAQTAESAATKLRF